MIEDIDPSILEPLTTYQVMIHAFDAEDWERVFARISHLGPEVWKQTYHIYLSSVAWKRKSRARKAIDKDRCQHPRLDICFLSHNLQVHHLHYRNIGNEDVENDLITLCERCHGLEHGRGAPLMNQILRENAKEQRS